MNKYVKQNAKLGAMLLAVAMSGAVLARPLDAIGDCPMAAKMTLATGPFEGDAQRMKSVEKFASQHILAATQEVSWIKSFSGGSGKNRLYTTAQQKVVIMTLCNPAECEKNRAYIAYEPATGAYGGSIYEWGPIRNLGLLPGPTSSTVWYPDQLNSAIICAQNLDWNHK